MRLHFKIWIANQIVDTHTVFRQFIKILNEVEVHKIKNLRRFKGEKALLGLCEFKTKRLFVSPRPKDGTSQPMVKTLIHELCHYAWELPEPAIRTLEEVFWGWFNEREKKILKSYIPRKYSKVGPAK